MLQELPNNAEDRPLNLLLSAYACRPNMGSEPGVGWSTVCEIAKYHKTWVLTRKDNQPFIDEALQHQPIANLCFVYCDLPTVEYWKNSLQSVHIHYYLWQIIAYLTAKKLHSQIGFNLIHHITYVRYSTPSFLSLLPVPFIWGPVGGGESAPLSFWQDFDWYGKTYELFRSILRWIGEIDPFVSLTARRSMLANATTPETMTRLQNLGAKNVQVQSQVGISKEEISTLAQVKIQPTSPVRFVSIGRLLHWKGFHLGLRAFAQANLADSEYWVIGDGREKRRLQQLTQDLNISSSVKFLGSLSRTEVLQKLAHCHVLVHPSLHESGGFVCTEAMASGRPVICLDLGGPAVQVTEETGVKIVAKNPTQVVDDLAQSMASFSTDPGRLMMMGTAAQKHVSSRFSWSQKGKLLEKLYVEIHSKLT